MGEKNGGRGSRKVVFLHLGSEPVLCKMENKIKSEIWNISGICWGGLETKEHNCQMIRFTALVTA